MGIFRKGEGRGGEGMKQVEIRIPKYNDVWMDNGVERILITAQREDM